MRGFHASVQQCCSREGVGLPPRHVFGRMTLRRKSADEPVATVLARLATCHDNDKWLNDTIFNSLKGQAEGQCLPYCSAKTVEAAYVLPDLSAFFHRVTVGVVPLLRLRTKAYMLFSTDREEAPPNRRVCCIGQHPLGYGLQG